MTPSTLEYVVSVNGNFSFKMTAVAGGLVVPIANFIFKINFERRQRSCFLLEASKRFLF